MNPRLRPNKNLSVSYARPFEITISLNAVDFPLGEKFLDSKVQKQISQQLERLGLVLLDALNLQEKFTVVDISRISAHSDSWLMPSGSTGELQAVLVASKRRDT
jgi:hypothetical protein